MAMRKSPGAAFDLRDLIKEDPVAAEEQMGKTDCEHGCWVEPDGTCPHGFESAALTLGVI